MDALATQGLESSDSNNFDSLDAEMLNIPAVDIPSPVPAASVPAPASSTAVLAAAQFNSNMPPPPVIPMPKQSKDAVSKMLGTTLDYKHAVGDITDSAAPNSKKPVGIPLPKNPQIVSTKPTTPAAKPAATTASSPSTTTAAAKPSPPAPVAATKPLVLPNIPAPDMMDALQKGTAAPPEKQKLKPVANDIPPVVYAPPAPAPAPVAAKPAPPTLESVGSATVAKASATSYKPKPHAAAAAATAAASETPKEALLFDQATISSAATPAAAAAAAAATSADKKETAAVDKTKITKELIQSGLASELPPPSTLLGTGVTKYPTAPEPAAPTPAPAAEPAPMETDTKPAAPSTPAAAAAKEPVKEPAETKKAPEPAPESSDNEEPEEDAPPTPPPQPKLDPVTGKPKSILKKKKDTPAPAPEPAPVVTSSTAATIPKNQPKEAEVQKPNVPKNVDTAVKPSKIVPRNDTPAEDEDEKSTAAKPSKKEKPKKEKKEKKDKKEKKQQEKTEKTKKRPKVIEEASEKEEEEEEKAPPKKGKKRPADEEEEEEESEDSGMLLAEEASEVPEGEEEESENANDENDLVAAGESENILDSEDEEEDSALDEYEEDGFIIDDLAEEKKRIAKDKAARLKRLAKKKGKNAAEQEAAEDSDELDEVYKPKKQAKLMEKKAEKEAKRLAIEHEIVDLQEQLAKKLARIKRLRAALEPDEDPNEDEAICQLKEERRVLQAKVDELNLKLGPQKPAEEAEEDEAEEDEVEEVDEAVPMEEDKKEKKKPAAAAAVAAATAKKPAPVTKKLDLTEEEEKPPAKKAAAATAATTLLKKAAAAAVKAPPTPEPKAPLSKKPVVAAIKNEGVTKPVHPLDKPLGKSAPGQSSTAYHTIKNCPTNDDGAPKDPKYTGSPDSLRDQLYSLLESTWIPFALLTMVDAIDPKSTTNTPASKALLECIGATLSEHGKIAVSKSSSLEALSLMRTFFHVSPAADLVELLTRHTYQPTMRDGVLLYIYDNIITPLTEGKLELEKTNPAIASLMPTVGTDFLLQLRNLIDIPKIATFAMPDTHSVAFNAKLCKELAIYAPDASEQDDPLLDDVFHVDVIQQLCDLIYAFYPHCKIGNIIKTGLSRRYKCTPDQVPDRLMQEIQGDVSKLDNVRDMIMEAAGPSQLLPLCKQMVDVWNMVLASKKKHHPAPGASNKKAKH